MPHTPLLVVLFDHHTLGLNGRWQLFLGVSHLIYVVVASCVGERWTVKLRYFTA